MIEGLGFDYVSVKSLRSMLGTDVALAVAAGFGPMYDDAARV